MELFSNWVFWVILVAIIFSLALIGYLSENMKKSKNDNKKEDNNESSDTTNNVNTVNTSADTVSAPTDNVSEVKVDDWTTMPEVKLEPLNVDSVSQPQAENPAPVSEVNTVDNVVSEPAANSVETLAETPQPVTEVVSVPTVEPIETLDTSSNDGEVVQQTTTDQAEKNNDIWNV